ncbi:predicted protein [Botrytis cinerea T4]|uniref:Uncharacterized protein n=1 Tax=Botryotinia fuckeliana (strain T4) TaxID=999810 RepID=G2YQM4_BOTF4|nr:predicted protein [Botrytis cinerea T4]
MVKITITIAIKHMEIRICSRNAGDISLLVSGWNSMELC